mmetsp:Transcript_42923/g.77119  ORF Transcript_42923/g.77119 Transcript_42923/m.77119 type:complete len:156 (+) Transcript_42923:485-952(+)
MPFQCTVSTTMALPPRLRASPHLRLPAQLRLALHLRIPPGVSQASRPTTSCTSITQASAAIGLLRTGPRFDRVRTLAKYDICDGTATFGRKEKGIQGCTHCMDHKTVGMVNVIAIAKMKHGPSGGFEKDLVDLMVMVIIVTLDLPLRCMQGTLNG